jgi:hypothetical protein
MSGKPRKLPSADEQTQCAIRLADDMLARIDRHRDRMADAVPGVKFTRADAVRALLTMALDQIDGRGKRR